MRLKIFIAFILIVIGFTTNAQIFHIEEDFNSGKLPSGWINTAISGSHQWKIGLDGSNALGPLNSQKGEPGNNNIDGTYMVIFDDDSLGVSQKNNTVELRLPAFDNSKSVKPRLEFDYNFRSITSVYPNTFDSLYVEVFDGMNWNLEFTVTENDCGLYQGFSNFFISDCKLNGFPHASIDLSSYTNSDCQIRFRYHDGNDWAFYTAIDNIKVSHLDSNDIGVSRIISPESNCGLSSKEKIQIELVNYGINAISNFDVKLNINNGNQIIIENVSDTLYFEDTLLYTLNSVHDFSEFGEFSLKVNTLLNLDTVPNNDSSFLLLSNDTLVHLPYRESFERNNHGWKTNGTNSSIEHGVPIGRKIDHASDGLNVFASNLSGIHNDRELSYLYSPCIVKSKDQDILFIEFDLFRDIERGDNLTLEYSIDDEVIWKSVKYTQIARNWYSFSNNTSWGDGSDDWELTRNIISNLSGITTLKLRFRFETDSRSYFEGFAIDNFKMFVGSKNDIALNNVYHPSSTSSNIELSLVKPSIQVSNLGLNRIDSFEVSYQVNEGVKFRDTIRDTISSFKAYDHTFSKAIDFRDTTHYLIDFEVYSLNDDNLENNKIFNHLILQNSSPHFSVPFRETFDSFEKSVSIAKNLSLKNGWKIINLGNPMNWRIGTYKDFISSNDPNLDQDRGMLIFSTEETNIQYNQIALISPFIQLNKGIHLLSFWFYSTSINGKLVVDVFDGEFWNNNFFSIPEASVNIPPGFEERVIDLTNFSEKKVKLRFKYGPNSAGSSELSHYSLDDISIYQPSSIDSKIRFANEFNNDCRFFNNPLLSINIQNNGIDTIQKDSMHIYYQHNNNPIVEAKVNLAIPPSHTIDFTFQQSIIYNHTIENKIKVWTQLKGDTINYDTIYKNRLFHQYKLPYYENFESFETSSCYPTKKNTLANGWKNDFSNIGFWQVIDGKKCLGSKDEYPKKQTNPNESNYLTSFLSTTAETSLLLSPCIDLGNSNLAVLTFNYFKNGLNSSDLFVDIYDFTTDDWFTIDSLKGKKQNSVSDDWNKKEIDLSTYTGVQMFRFRERVLNNEATSIVIDDIRVYNKINQDIELTHIINPISSCNLSTNEMVTIKIQNTGTVDIQIDSIGAILYLNDSILGKEKIPTVIKVDSSIIFTFNQTVDLSVADSLYTLKVELELIGDSNYFNNIASVYSIDNFTKEPGYTEDFESFGRGEFSLDNESNQIGSDELKNGWEAFPSSIDKKYHWNLQKLLDQEKLTNFGATKTMGTGPATDYSLTGDHFFYTEASYGSEKDEAFLTFPCMDLTDMDAGSLQFWYHKFGSDMGDLYIDIFAEGNWNMSIDSIIGETHRYHIDNWKKKVINLNPFIGGEVEIRFRAIKGNGDMGDMAIDNVEILDSIASNVVEFPRLSNDEETKLLLYPNPNQGHFNLEVSNSLIGNNFIIFNYEGKVVFENEIKDILNPINLTTLNKGIYFLRVSESGLTKKFILF